MKLTERFAGRHPATLHVLQYFTWEHLPTELQAVSMRCAMLAEQMTRDLPDGPELTAALRKLLEAKDCFVRADIDRLPNKYSTAEEANPISYLPGH